MLTYVSTLVVSFFPVFTGVDHHSSPPHCLLIYHTVFIIAEIFLKLVIPIY